MALSIQKARRFHRKRCRWTIVLCLIVHSSCIYFPNFCFKLPMFHSYFCIIKYNSIVLIRDNSTYPIAAFCCPIKGRNICRSKEETIRTPAFLRVEHIVSSTKTVNYVIRTIPVLYVCHSKTNMAEHRPRQSSRLMCSGRLPLLAIRRSTQHPKHPQYCQHSQHDAQELFKRKRMFLLVFAHHPLCRFLQTIGPLVHS